MLSQRSSLTPLTLLLLLLLAAAAIFLALSAQATVVQRLEIEELTRLSTDVFHGEIVSTQTYWNAEHTRIYTGVNVRINESLKGSSRRGETIKVVQLGGEKDGSKTDYAGRPEFQAGESAILFTTRTRNNELTVVGLKQGKMQVNGQTVTRDFSGLTVLERSKSGGELQAAKASPMQLTLTELRERVMRTK
ncbi:MAG TPA: hypothetical protein PLD20_31620 [Blastocatellia bacterium]|nr:hypothetical protein [Blastocatellia bacterium]HMX28977.1 hypothetical protein [Blastocatellia bacterium]HMY76529.1 hypothetical protein [Blastocatellia bacterium]HMZ22522.1 hypothetical protein [Blastocatellia bacterium]HNG31970.1 hypothetical protein [Blastocatellia bacterium]